MRSLWIKIQCFSGLEILRFLALQRFSNPEFGGAQHGQYKLGVWIWLFQMKQYAPRYVVYAKLQKCKKNQNTTTTSVHYWSNTGQSQYNSVQLNLTGFDSVRNKNFKTFPSLFLFCLRMDTTLLICSTFILSYSDFFQTVQGCMFQ